MRLSLITVIKSVWVSSGLFMLPLGLGTCLVDPGDFASQALFPIMLLLSFPAGPLVLLVGALVIDPPPINPALDYSLLWFVAFAAGYLQWFWAFPKLFGKPEFTTLGLTETLPLAVADTLPPRLPKRLRVGPRNRMAHFDNHGRTPLERVIIAGIKRKPASQMSSEKRRDLPRINRFPGHLR